MLKEQTKYEKLLADTSNRRKSRLEQMEKGLIFAETAQKRFNEGSLEKKTGYFGFFRIEPLAFK